MDFIQEEHEIGKLVHFTFLENIMEEIKQYIVVLFYLSSTN